MRQSPTLGAVRKLAELLERPQVVNESSLVEPRELINLPVKNCQPFAKRLIRQSCGLDHLARLDHDFTQRRLPLPPGTFVKISVKKLQALCKSSRIMRKTFHHSCTQNWNRRRLRDRNRGRL